MISELGLGAEQSLEGGERECRQREQQTKAGRNEGASRGVLAMAAAMS